MATLASQGVVTGGLKATYSSATATTGDRFLTGDGAILHVKNGSGVSVTATLTTPGTVDGLAIGDRAITIPAGEERFIAVPDSLYRASDGLGTLVCAPVTTVTVACIRI